MPTRMHAHLHTRRRTQVPACGSSLGRTTESVGTPGSVSVDDQPSGGADECEHWGRPVQTRAQRDAQHYKGSAREHVRPYSIIQQSDEHEQQQVVNAVVKHVRQ